MAMQIFYDRRDAASALCNIKLCDNDIPFLEKFIDWFKSWFLGGPAFAAEAIANIGSKASLSSLSECVFYLETSDYHEKDHIIYRIRELLVFADKEIWCRKGI